jgi:hypothetical protein
MKPKHQTDYSLVLVGLIIMIAIAVSSCATNGYGCRGKSKIMTRVRQ